MEWSNPEDDGTRPIVVTHITTKPPGYTMDKTSPNRLKNKRPDNINDEGDSWAESSITENKRRKICIDSSKTENELRKKRKIDYPPVTEVIVKKQKTLHTTRKKRKRNGEVYRNNRQKKKKHEIIVID